MRLLYDTFYLEDYFEKVGYTIDFSTHKFVNINDNERFVIMQSDIIFITPRLWDTYGDVIMKAILNFERDSLHIVTVHVTDSSPW